VERIRHVFGLESDWERPLDRRRAVAVDLACALVLAVGGVLSMDSARSLSLLSTDHIPNAMQYALVVSVAVGFAARRLFPIAAMVYAIGHYVVLGLFARDMAPVFALQVYYCLSLFSVLAWARDRAAALVLTVLMAVAGAVWTAEVALGGGLDQFAQLPDEGPLPTVLAAVVQVTLLTSTFLLAAIGAGLVAWWSARREDTARRQAALIASQVEQLNARSVADERLRIARELHDVVGHHVAVMGIQAAAAERLRDHDSELSAEALVRAQDASRDATHDLRLMLSALRTAPATGSEPTQTIVSGGGMDGLATVVDRFADLGLDVSLTLLGPRDTVPLAVGDCVQRVTQEALTNVQRHSTATHADVSVTVDEHEHGMNSLRLAIRDHGEAVPKSVGAGIGLVGMQERVSLCGGTLQHGPLHDRPGFEVKATFTWSEDG
jgi:signal transduction histidine kinase